MSQANIQDDRLVIQSPSLAIRIGSGITLTFIGAIFLFFGIHALIYGSIRAEVENFILIILGLASSLFGINFITTSPQIVIFDRTTGKLTVHRNFLQRQKVSVYNLADINGIFAVDHIPIGGDISLDSIALELKIPGEPSDPSQEKRLVIWRGISPKRTAEKISMFLNIPYKQRTV